jgi:hypothetical protein
MKILWSILLFSILLFSFSQCSLFKTEDDESYKLQKDPKIPQPNAEVKVTQPKEDDRLAQPSNGKSIQAGCFRFFFSTVQRQALTFTLGMFLLAVIIFAAFFFGHHPKQVVIS